jgi:RimJ/RimL family protein N-acetyltransferase
LLEGKNVNLRIVEKEDLELFTEWVNDLEFTGEYEPVSQVSKTGIEKHYDKLRPEEKWFMIEQKDGSKIGLITHLLDPGKRVAIGYFLVTSERRKGFGTEAVRIMVDYLFLSKNIVRIQAETHPKNVASHRVLEKAGFTREGTIRKSFFSRGVWRDTVLFSILREEWKEPQILTKKTDSIARATRFVF